MYNLYLWHFDVLTLTWWLDVGHLDFLEKAAAKGDFLIVGLHTDPVSLKLFIHVQFVFILLLSS